ncbi:MAG TPA: hypothetical protein VF472_11785 [Burkholderiaceae bacterium]
MDKLEYLQNLETACGKAASYFDEINSKNGPPIGVIGFDDYPAKGQFTYFSYGLHMVRKPEWKFGRPEYFITIDNDNRLFAVFFGYLISAFAWEKVMGWNTLIGVGDNDAVEGYPYRRIALGPPMYLGWESYAIEGDDLPIHLGMAYLISDGDFEEAAETGFGYLAQKSKESQDYWRTIQRR